ncbi:MAG: hypothetical protein K2W96_11720 [Gemmataceae bacterium]|nr:hypothetical protein [Gemmataceae bacterium]
MIVLLIGGAGRGRLPAGVRVVGDEEAKTVSGSQVGTCKRAVLGKFCTTICGFTTGVPVPGVDPDDPYEYKMVEEKCVMDDKCKYIHPDKSMKCSP